MGGAMDLDHLRRWIGREDICEDVITATLAARFHATLALPGEPPAAGAPAPPLIHFCLGQPARPMEELGPDGHPARGGFLPPVQLPRRMWAGGTIDFHGDPRVGDTVVRRSRIADITGKTGRSGSLCFVTIEHELMVGGTPMVSERQTLVYREAAAPGPETGASHAPPAPAGKVVEAIDPSPLLLFRYSALTFNGHRIHYDLPYARAEEGYRGLVVHGPLQATLLLLLAARCHGGRRPDRFAFRGLAPAFAGEPLLLNAGEMNAGTMDLWTVAAGGAAAMQATAEWR